MRKVKAKSSDYQINDLPKNRTQVFFDVVKNQWRKLLLLGAILFIAFLPYVIVIFFRDNYALGLSNALANKELSDVDAYKLFCISHLIASFASWLSFYFTSFLLGGVVRIVRQLIWGEPVFFKEDLIMGGKQNYKFGAIVSTFFGAILVVNSLVLFTKPSVIIQSLPMALFIALILPPLLLTYFQGTIYNGNFKSLFHNSVLMYIKKAPHTLFFTFILILPFFLRFIDSFLVLKYILIVVSILFLVVFFIMMFSLFSCYVFDIYINPQFYPDIVRKGMSKNEN